jgi:uncharacterized protein
VKRLFLDANVLFQAAYNPAGKSAFIVSLSKRGAWKIYTNNHAIEEARRNIELKSPGSINRFIRLMKQIQRIPYSGREHCPINLPNKDKPIMISAVLCNATHLITLDRKHFGKYMNKPKQTAGIIIQSVGEFLDSL